VPASNNKLITSAGLYLLLNASTSSPGFYKTPFLLSTTGGTNAPVLCVVGQGDPSIKLQDFAGVAARLKTMGLTRLDSIVLDRSFFKGDGQPFPCTIPLPSLF